MDSQLSGAQDTAGAPAGAQRPPGASIPYTVGGMGLQRSKYDPDERRQSQRKQRERGVWVYIPAEEMLKAGRSVFEGPPKYRVWGRRGGSVLVRLYKGGDE